MKTNVSTEAKAKEIIRDLKSEGFDNKQIRDIMEDGAYLGEEGISQEVAEEVHAMVKYKEVKNGRANIQHHV